MKNDTNWHIPELEIKRQNSENNSKLRKIISEIKTKKGKQR